MRSVLWGAGRHHGGVAGVRLTGAISLPTAARGYSRCTCLFLVSDTGRHGQFWPVGACHIRSTDVPSVCRALERALWRPDLGW